LYYCCWGQMEASNAGKDVEVEQPTLVHCC
jgi:hypothetical protein